MAVSMKGIPGTHYAPGDSSHIYAADPDTGILANRDTGVPGVELDYVAKLLLAGCVLADTTSPWN